MALRGASLKVKLWEAEVNAIGVALKGRLINNEDAIMWLREIDALHLLGHIPDQKLMDLRKGKDIVAEASP